MRKLVPRCLCGLIAISHISVGHSADVLVPVEKAAECMLEVLRTTPGVIGPVLGTTTSEGWTHPFLEYRADEALTSKSTIRFDSSKDASGRYWFLAMKSGLGAPEFHVTNAVLDKWKMRCHAEVILLFP